VGYRKLTKLEALNPHLMSSIEIKELIQALEQEVSSFPSVYSDRGLTVIGDGGNAERKNTDGREDIVERDGRYEAAIDSLVQLITKLIGNLNSRGMRCEPLFELLDKVKGGRLGEVKSVFDSCSVSLRQSLAIIEAKERSREEIQSLGDTAKDVKDLIDKHEPISCGQISGKSGIEQESVRQAIHRNLKSMGYRNTEAGYVSPDWSPD